MLVKDVDRLITNEDFERGLPNDEDVELYICLRADRLLMERPIGLKL